MGIRVGIDTGGTFTDLVALDEESGKLSLAKVPSNPRNQVAAITSALETADFDPKDVSLIVVGTTIGINAVLTRRGARVVYLTTQGFEDVPYIQRISRKYHYDYHWRKPVPLARRPDCVGVNERISEEGNVIVPLDLDELDQVASHLTSDADGREAVAVAVCYLFSYLNPEHEVATRDELHKRYPDLPVSLSHEVAPIWREYERGTTVIVDAYLKPLLRDYVSGLSQAFKTQGVHSPWTLLKSNGGHALSDEAQETPSHLLLSGIAGGAIGGAFFARMQGADKAIALDMGGTSCDVCLITNGEPLYASDFEIEFGLPVSVQSVSTRTIGAGGGSIGWLDPGGFLQVGPQSAGADPGPACYGKGGQDAAITDANVVLGRLDPQFFLGGKLDLNSDLSRIVVRRLGERLGMNEVDTASAMVRIANENMANAIRIVTVEEGIDPREFALIAIGGAGPTHAAEISDAIGISRVIVPENPGLCSAFGALAAQVRVDALKSVHLTSTQASAAGLNRLFQDLEGRALADFNVQDVSGSTPQIRRSIAMRYQGQNYEQDVPVAAGTLGDDDITKLFEDYHRLHEAFYGYRFEGIPIELVRLLVVVGDDDTTPVMISAQTGSADAVDNSVATTRQVYFPEHGFLDTPIARREHMRSGQQVQGPMIIESMDTTIVVPPQWEVESYPTGTLELHRRAPQSAEQAVPVTEDTRV